MISPTLKPLSDSTQHYREGDLHVLSGIQNPNTRKGAVADHVLDHAATGIDNSRTYSFHLKMEHHHKEQESENKLAIFIANHST